MKQKISRDALNVVVFIQNIKPLIFINGCLINALDRFLYQIIAIQFVLIQRCAVACSSAVQHTIQVSQSIHVVANLHLPFF